ncbi:MAG TPA: hypothetical protein VFG52_04570 [Xanthomonadales bacterium]|nr:hypothetical protein [Xanthomonadales bacterium]
MILSHNASTALLGQAFFALWLLVGVAAGALAGDKPNWEKASALQAAAQANSQLQVQSWQQQIDAGQAAAVLVELQQSSGSGSPGFEAQLYGLAQTMAEAPLDATSDRLLAWLENYSPAVLVAHEESASHGVPLFPVAAAAKGSRLERQRRTAQLRADALVADPQRWIAHFLAASPVEQQGLQQGLRKANPATLAPLARMLPGELAGHAELAMPTGIVASILADTALFTSALQHSQGADTVQILREANWRLDMAQRIQLFHTVLALPQPGHRALGVSMLAPGLHSNPAVSTQLLEMLDDEDLGAAAALALAGHPDSQVQASLRQKLQEGGRGAQRASLAQGLPLGLPANDTLKQADGDPQ